MTTGRSVAFEATSDEAGERVDKAVAARLEREGVSRSSVGRWCAEGRISVQGRSVRASVRLRDGDSVEVEVPPPEPVEAIAEDLPISVVFEDHDLLVVDKPAGLVVHPSRGHATGTLVNAVLHHVAVDDDDPLRPGVVHRIDRDTSGLLVIAKTPAARAGLMELFRTHDIERSYLALVEGTPPLRITYDTLHGRHPTDRLKFSSRVSEGKRSCTHVTVEETLADGVATLVRCALETGRTHQIRVHLADAGFPILGDSLYGRRAVRRLAREAEEAAGRQCLHAEVLGFVHPVTGEALRFVAPMPDDFRRALAVLRGEPTA